MPTDGTTRRAKGRHHDAGRDTIVYSVVEDMLEGRWVVGRSHLALMAKHDVKIDVVRGWACDASRFIRLCREQSPEEIRERILLSIERAERMALEFEKSVYDGSIQQWVKIKEPNLRALKDFLQLQCEVHGLIAHEAKAPRQPADAVAVPMDELRGVLESLGFDIVRKNDTDGSSSTSSDASEG